jgi:alanyl-tRNA synthetase
MNSREIRSSFLSYFERNGHRVVPSSPLVPHDDPTLLFTNAGMNQFKDVFLGKDRRDYRRAASSQKCMRVSGKHNDLENVGPSLRHHTFFEMLGNFSFGDYFKKEAIPFAWELLTGVWEIPADRLFATVFSGESGIPRDSEAYEIWLKLLPAERVLELGLADNFWQMGETGPCGRCSEIHYFRGNAYPCSEPVCRGVECSCDRYMEIWNNVFMEFNRAGDGTLTPLPAPSIDTGMGLERISAVLQGVVSNYDTDLFTPILRAIGDIGDVAYGGPAATDTSMRVIADHIRATTFLIADGVVPSNEWRGYVLRKIMRRGMRHGKRIGITRPFLHRLVDVLVREMGDAYPELGSSRDAIVRVVQSEEERFDAVLTGGLPRLEEALDQSAATGVFGGDQAFRLYDTFGLPLEFIEDMAEERKLHFDREGFERAMEGQRDKARAKSAFKTDVKEISWAPSTEDARRLEQLGDTFTGYAETRTTGVQIEILFDDKGQPIDSLGAGAAGFAALTRSPFYVEAGGQVSDSGRIYGASGEALVQGLVRVPRWPRLHAITVTSGVLRTHDIVTAEVEDAVRDATRRNHTATHLLHAALRQVLGTHVRQAGSLVAPDRLRFDFVHFAAVTREQLDEIERIVNAQIYRNTPVRTDERSTQEAIAEGAMALFGEKYGDRVRVVSVPGFSMELCGGTHVRATGDIGLFAITSESGVAAGTRRIEAVTGADAVRRYQHHHAIVDRVVEAAGVPADQVAEVVQRLQSDVKRLTREVSQLKMKAMTGKASEKGALDRESAVGDIRVVQRDVKGLNKEQLRSYADSLKGHEKQGVVVVTSSSDDGKVAVVVSVTPNVAALAPAGQLVKRLAPIIGGGGGGRADFAEAGGKDSTKIKELHDSVPGVLKEVLDSARRG